MYQRRWEETLQVMWQGIRIKMVIMEAPIKLIVFWMEDLNYQELREINY